MGLLDSIKRAISGSPGAPADDFRPGSADAIERLITELATCPVCGKDFRGHQLVLFAYTPLDEKNRKRVRELFDALDERRWSDLKKFKEWNGRGANAEVYVICCVTGDAAVAVLHSSPTPAKFKNVERCACAGGQSARELLALVPERAWQPIAFVPAATDRILPT
ncbi:MAG: hypothetical protein WBE20_02595 [Candidatus Acidiferrales bacterium]